MGNTGQWGETTYGTSNAGNFTLDKFADRFEELLRAKRESKKLLRSWLERKQEEQESMKDTRDIQEVVNALREHNADHSLIEALANAAFPEDSGIKRHEGLDILLPEGMELPEVINTIERAERSLEQGRTSEYYFEGYAYDDMLVALDKAIKQMFGFGIQRGMRSLFGVRPPKTKTVVLGRDRAGHRITEQVPEGVIALPGLWDENDETGKLVTYDSTPPNIDTYLKKKHQKVGDQLVGLVRHYLETESIYRGQIVTGALSFVHFGEFKMDDLVLNTAVRQNIEHNVMLHILNPDLSDRIGAEPQRSALFYGPYGTGKSMAMREIAVRAADAGVTVFMHDGNVEMEKLLRWARNYQPSVVMIEDVDQELAGARGSDMNAILNTLDGALGKQDRVFTIMTTNNPGRIHEAALRPGRISVAVKFGALDGQGLRRLIGQSGLNFSGEIDWDTLAQQYPELMPCHVKEAGNRLGFQHQAANGDLGEEDVKYALEGMMDHLRLQQAANSQNDDVTITDLLGDLTEDRLKAVLKSLAEKSQGPCF